MDLFQDMSDALAAQQQPAQLFVVGGAAMALAYDDQRATHDLDGLFQPSSIVRDIASDLALANALDDDWLNDAVKGFLPGNDPDRVTVFESEYLLVQVASPRYLLAMKLFSARLGRDDQDAVKLFEVCGLHGANEALALLEEYYPTDMLTSRHMYVVNEIASQVVSERSVLPRRSALALDEPDPNPAPSVPADQQREL